MTPEQARLIIDAHDIVSSMGDREERELLRLHNPQLFFAYIALLIVSAEEGG